jgi:hypothetical protein
MSPSETLFIYFRRSGYAGELGGGKVLVESWAKLFEGFSEFHQRYPSASGITQEGEGRSLVFGSTTRLTWLRSMPHGHSDH